LNNEYRWNIIEGARVEPFKVEENNDSQRTTDGDGVEM
jgi:hypothetical protein